MENKQLTDVIQICTDGSELSLKGVNTGISLAKAMGLPVVGMTVVVDKEVPANGLEGEDESVRSRLNDIAEKAREAGVECQVVAEHCDAPWRGIVNAALRYDSRFVVMASRGLGSFSSLILGSETQKVLSEIDRPVLVIR